MNNRQTHLPHAEGRMLAVGLDVGLYSDWHQRLADDLEFVSLEALYHDVLFDIWCVAHGIDLIIFDS